MSHIFLITHKKFYGQKVFPWEDTSENVTKLYPTLRMNVMSHHILC